MHRTSPSGRGLPLRAAGLRLHSHSGLCAQWFQVGPNYERRRPRGRAWIDADDVRIRTESDDLSAWWKVFNDPALRFLDLHWPINRT